jgi:hypothetical protein
MTTQYLIGDLSVLLARLQAEDGDQLGAPTVSLRHRLETLLPDELAPVVIRALAVVDRMCWKSLTRGDTDAFVRQAAIGADLAEFGECAGLLSEDERRQQEARQ